MELNETLGANEVEEGIRAFREAFPGNRPTHLSRAPGRVNLIGEHTDYNGLPVFPMALRQEMRILFRRREDQEVRVANENAEFEPRWFRLDHSIPKNPSGDWGNYLKAPCQALTRKLGPLQGMDALVTSTVPVASGLSSSSALVIAVGKALLEVNGAQLPELVLAEEMARAERYTGTQGGGMDQAISLTAREGHASRIEFEPLRAFATPVPPGWRFLVANTMIRAEKSGGAQEAYNRRREECGEALSRLGKVLGLASDGSTRAPDPSAPDPSDRTRLPTDLSYPALLKSHELEELLSLGQDHLPSPLRQRFRHVATEAVRVYEAQKAMERGDLISFGILMDASHESLRTDYEVSSPELDRLVALARGGGGAGARLTGAGFGGCIVALVDGEHAERVQESLISGYFRERGQGGFPSQVLFPAEPAQGASVFPLT